MPTICFAIALGLWAKSTNLTDITILLLSIVDVVLFYLWKCVIGRRRVLVTM
jgi:hypothetical protein